MCVYSRKGENKRYLPNKKNGGKPEIPKYERLKGIEYKCGYCIDCRRERANSWRIRLREEIKDYKKSIFVTLTFTEEALDELEQVAETNECKKVATIAMRRFLERVRKATGKSLKHWFITELGQNGTERLHMHGIIFTDKTITEKELAKWWAYGRIDIGRECSERTINYITKYITKLDPKHKGYLSVILTSPGIGKNYIEKHRATHVFRDEKTITTYRHPTGAMVSLPCYYKRKLWSDEEREELRMYAELKQVKWLNKTGYKVTNYEEFMTFEIAKTAYKEELERLGFPTPKECKDRIYRTRNAEYRRKAVETYGN